MGSRASSSGGKEQGKMEALSVTEVRRRLYRLVDEMAETHEPVLVAGKRNRVVIVGESDWRAIQETLHVLRDPAARGCIVEGLATPVEECSEALDW
jgi:antitoxin YefM